MLDQDYLESMDLVINKMKKFCVIAVDYENHVPRNENNIFKTSIFHGLESLANQTFKDFDLIICHDGPKSKTYEDEGLNFKRAGLSPIIINTPERMNDWGHSSRDYAMRYAYENNIGEYYVIFNIDNYFEPWAFSRIAKEIENKKNNIVLFTVKHHKAYRSLDFKPEPFEKLNAKMLSCSPYLLKVNPDAKNIDAMQLVAHRDVWKENNFWWNKDFCADGIMYNTMCMKHSFSTIENQCLGHNF